MIILKLVCEIEMMVEFGVLLVDVYKNLCDFIKLGIISWDIEVFVRNYIESYGGIVV